MDGIIVVAIIWFIIRLVANNAKKQADARRKAVREEADGYQPKPAEQQYQGKPRGLGGWAEMLGQLVGEETPGAQKPAVPASPWQNDAAFPPAARVKEPTPKKIAKPVAPAPAYAIEREELAPMQPTQEAPVMGAGEFLPERWDAPALVKGVIFAEVLTRPVHRRRPGMR